MVIKFIYILRIHFYAKYQFLIKKREVFETKHLNDSKVFIEYSNDMPYINENIEDTIQDRNANY